MSARSPQKPVDSKSLATLLSTAERELSRQARERLEGGAGSEDWFALLEEAVVHLRRTARELERAGYPARFVSLGKVGHTYVGALPQTLKDTVKWVTEGVTPPAGTPGQS